MASSAAAASDNDQTASVVGQMYGGLTFLKTRDRLGMVEFYQSRLGMKVWLEQPDITILAHGNFLLGFHQLQQHQQENDTVTTTTPDTQGVYTFVYPTTQAVNDLYQTLSDTATGPPKKNAKYRIYNFFAKDPEGRTLECQAFLHDVTTVTSDPQATQEE